MAWVAVDKTGKEFIGSWELTKYEDEICFSNYFPSEVGYQNKVQMPNGSIEKLIGKKLIWEDDPVELVE